MACRQFGTTSLFETMTMYCQFYYWKQVTLESKSNSNISAYKNAFENIARQNITTLSQRK